MKSRAEKTQKGNPHDLTLRQHIFPRASIARFVEAGGVDVYDLRNHLRRRATPGDHIFCADRAWAHGPESGWMKDMEDAFQDLAEGVLLSPPAAFDEAQSATISDFYALWHARAERRHLPSQRIPASVHVIGMRVDYTADDLERLEKNGISAFRGDGSISMRHIMGPRIRLDMFASQKGLADKPWNVVTADEGDFCIPDMPAHGIIPLTPRIALSYSRSGPVNRDELILINWCLASKSREYLFARSLDDCPGIA